jgi:hypothetical protein
MMNSKGRDLEEGLLQSHFVDHKPHKKPSWVEGETQEWEAIAQRPDLWQGQI